jgi:site-specific DNA recombinase
VTRQIDRLVEAILGGTDALAVNTKLKELEARQVVLTDKLGATSDAEPLLHPALATIYRDKVARLEHALRTPDTPQEAFELIRGLIDSVQLLPVGNDLEIELRGDLADILTVPKTARTGRYSAENKALQIKMVAGVGFEPTTFRL